MKPKNGKEWKEFQGKVKEIDRKGSCLLGVNIFSVYIKIPEKIKVGKRNEKTKSDK